MSGFLVNGFQEIVRSSNRFSLRRQLAAKDRKRRDALAELGRSAWGSGVDLTEFSQQREQLQRLEARAGELGATAARLERERTDLEARRQDEVARFDGLLQPARARQAEADAALKTARAALAEKDKAIQAVDTSLARLGAELKKAEDTAASAAGQAGAQAAAGAGREQLERQRATLTEQSAAEAAARHPLAAEVARRSDQSAKAAGEVGRLEAEKKAALVPIDTDLKRVRQESSGAMRERATVGREQVDRFMDLGLALYERKTAAPALTAPTEAVAAIDRDRGTTQAAIDRSRALSGAMPPGTMAKFWAVVVVLPLVCLAAAYAAYARFAAPASSDDMAATATQPAAASGLHPEEMRKDEIVKLFVSSKNKSARDDAVTTLEADLMAIGSSADRSSLPLLEAVLRRGEPELRAAAAHAIGMIGPTAAELPLLVDALNDPAPTVRDAVASALDQVDDPSGRLLVRRMRSSAPERSRSRTEGLKPTELPDASRLGVPVYAGAEFLRFASDLESGRFAFASPDPIDKVRQFYQSAAGSPALGGEEFSRMYLGGSPGDPSGAERFGVDSEAWVKEALKSGRPKAELEAEMTRRAAQMAGLPLVRYADTSLYGSPVFIAFGAPRPGGAAGQVSYVAIFEDRALGRTGFELRLPLK